MSRSGPMDTDDRQFSERQVTRKIGHVVAVGVSGAFYFLFHPWVTRDGSRLDCVGPRIPGRGWYQGIKLGVRERHWVSQGHRLRRSSGVRDSESRQQRQGWKRSKPVADCCLRRRTGRLFRDRGAAEAARRRRHRGPVRPPADALRSRSRWCRPGPRKDERRHQAVRENRRATRLSFLRERHVRHGSSPWQRSWLITTRSCLPPAPRVTGVSAFRPKICQGAILQRHLSGGTTAIPTTATHASTLEPSRWWWSATAMSQWTWPAS